MIKSPLSRIGGKYFMKNWLLQKIPKHKIYVEPFAGAAHLFFAKPQSKIEILNDLDSHLTCFFRVIQNPEKRVNLVQVLDEIPYSRNEFVTIKHRWRNGDFPEDETRRVAEWYFLNKASFAADFKRGGFATVTRKSFRNPCKGFRNSVNTFKDIGERLKDVTFECVNFDACILKYDTADTFFYVDCPYLGSRDYYSQSFTEAHHRQLAKILHSVKGKVVASHYSNSIYDDLYKDWNRDEFDSFTGSITMSNQKNNKRTTKEMVFCNF